VGLNYFPEFPFNRFFLPFLLIGEKKRLTLVYLGKGWNWAILPNSLPKKIPIRIWTDLARLDFHFPRTFKGGPPLVGKTFPGKFSGLPNLFY